MTTWEYHTVRNWKQAGALDWSSTLDKALDDLGRQGWELVAIVDREMHINEWVFKRPGLNAPSESAFSFQEQRSA
jgi:hypothetical protein